MKYTAEDGTFYKSKKGYWQTIEPMRANAKLTNYINRMKYKFNEQFVKKMHEYDRNYHRNRYQNNQKFREKQKKYSKTRIL